MPLPSGNTRLADAVFCALDFETTGINPVIDEIVEIGLVKFTLEREISTYSSLVNPQMDIPQSTILIHGINNDMVKNAPSIDQLLSNLGNFVEGCPLIIQNPRFDLAFLKVACQKSGTKIPDFHAYDTVSLARKTLADVPNYRLETLCCHLGIHIKPHRALSDARGCMEVFRKIILLKDKSGNWDFNMLNRLHGKLFRPNLTVNEKRKLKINSRLTAGNIVKIRYRDNAGSVTVRSIMPKQLLKSSGTTYVYAYCYLRNEHRYFNAKRILWVN